MKDAHRRNSSEIWLSRPLPVSWCHYASYDIILLSRLREKLDRHLRGCETRIQKESHRYAELNHEARINRDSKWHSHGFLPQEILGGTQSGGDRRRCPGCCRDLHQLSFYTTFRVWHKKPFTLRLCFTCFGVHRETERRYETSQNMH